jgi:hypothetical protein
MLEKRVKWSAPTVGCLFGSYQLAD